jgi:hypothetical protein
MTVLGGVVNNMKIRGPKQILEEHHREVEKQKI